DPRRRADGDRRERARRSRARPHRQGVGGRAGPGVRDPGRRQGPRPARPRAPPGARHRGRVRRRHRDRRARAHPRADGSAGAAGGLIVGLRVSPVGWGVAVVALLGLVLGRWFGWLELAALGAALTAVLVVSLLMTAGRARYEIRLDMADRRVKVGERAVGRVDVKNVARRRSLPSRVELPVGAAVAEFSVPALAPGAEHDDLFAIPTARRA